MPWLTRSDFTGTDGSPWPLTPGSWSHVDESGLRTQTETVQVNRGRHDVTVGAAGYRRHHAETTIAASHVECRVTMWRNAGPNNVGGGIMVASDGGGNYLYVSATVTGKSTSSGVRLDTVSGGTHTTTRTSAGVSALHTADAVRIAVRCWGVDGVCIVQAKTWLTAEPAWLQPTSYGAGNGATDTGTDWARLWHVLARSSYGSTGLATQWILAATGSIDYDDWAVNELFVLGRASGTDSPVVVPGRKLAVMATATETNGAMALGARKQVVLVPATTQDTGRHLPLKMDGGTQVVEETGIDIHLLARHGIVWVR